MWQNWVNLILGLWIILSAYLNMSPSSLATNLTISGLLVAALALWAALQYRSKSGNMYSGRDTHSHA